MSCNWPRVQISEVCELIVDCVNKTAPRVDYETPFKMIRTPNVKGGKISLNDCRFVEEDTYEKWTRRAKVLRDDVLLTREAPMGEVGIVDFDDTVFLGQRIMQYRVDRSKLDPHFLLYSFLSSDLQHQFNMHEGSGSVVSHIRVPDCSKFELNLPPLNIQKEIADVLKKLDRKISVNQQTNQTLEEMAQAIFKSWFVDFDPVKAKMNGEQPEGMDAATASLFPEKLVESELGLIPEDWKVSSLSELIKLTGGGTPKRSEETYWNGDIPWFSVKDVPSGSNVFVVDTDEKITELGLNKSSTKLLPKGTTIITARGTVGKLALVGTDMCMNQSCYGIRGKDVGDYYNYFNLKEAVSTLQRNTHGAVFDTITTKTFDTYSMAFSGAELANKFDMLVAPLLQKIEANVRQNIELATLRDTLLPKLLSGEIELGTSEELVEAI